MTLPKEPTNEEIAKSISGIEIRHETNPMWILRADIKEAVKYALDLKDTRIVEQQKNDAEVYETLSKYCSELEKALKFAKRELDKLGMGHDIVDKALSPKHLQAEREI